MRVKVIDHALAAALAKDASSKSKALETLQSTLKILRDAIAVILKHVPNPSSPLSRAIIAQLEEERQRYIKALSMMCLGETNGKKLIPERD